MTNKYMQDPDKKLEEDRKRKADKKARKKARKKSNEDEFVLADESVMIVGSN